jgi:hypothetical protein
MHTYGPHDPALDAVWVDLATGKRLRSVPADDLLVRPRDFVRIAPGAVKQLRDLNNLAYQRSRP